MLKLLTRVVINKLKLKIKYCHILNAHFEIVISVSTDIQAILSFPHDYSHTICWNELTLGIWTDMTNIKVKFIHCRSQYDGRLKLIAAHLFNLAREWHSYSSWIKLTRCAQVVLYNVIIEYEFWSIKYSLFKTAAISL